METLIIDFNQDNEEIKNSIIEYFGEDIENQFIESKKFNGDILNIFTTIIIPITMPILTVLIQKYLEKDDNDTKKTDIKIIYKNEIFIIKENNINNFLSKLNDK